MSAPPAPTPAERFAADTARLVLVFFAVAAIDLVAGSLLTGHLRVWFPVWLDRDWATRPDPWVVYSQSYLAGVAVLPLFARAIDRDLLAGHVGAAARAGFWALVVGVLAFIAWWKGGLMAAHGKEREGLAWLALTGLVLGVVRAAEVAPARARALPPRALLRRVLQGVAAFFLVMAVLDPVLQLAVQGVEVSSGLVIEVAFFLPAGLGLLAACRALGAPGAGAPGAA